MLASAGKACQGFLVLAAVQGTPATKQGLLEAIALQQKRSQALAQCLFCGRRCSKTQRGSGEVAPGVSLQALASIPPCGAGMATTAQEPSSSSLHTRKDQWGWGLPLNHGVWCSTVALLLEPTAGIPPARAGRMPRESCNQLLGFSPSLFPSRY